MKALANTKELTEAVAAVRNALTTRSTLREELSRAELNEKAETHRIDALLTKAASGTGDISQKERAELADARGGMLAYGARIEGLQMKLDRNKQELKTLLDRLEAARGEWLLAVLKAFEPSYRSAVNAFEAATRQLVALGHALGEQQVINAAKRNEARFPYVDGNLLVVFESVYKQTGGPSGMGGFEQVPTWDRDKVAVDLFNAHREPSELQSQLETAIRQSDAEIRSAKVVAR